MAWSQVAASAEYGAREAAIGVTFANRLWMIGGEKAGTVYSNDVWDSPPGAGATPTLTAPVTPAITLTPSRTPVPSDSPTSTSTASRTPVWTATPSPSPSRTLSPAPTATVTPASTPSPAPTAPPGLPAISGPGVLVNNGGILNIYNSCTGATPVVPTATPTGQAAPTPQPAPAIPAGLVDLGTLNIASGQTVTLTAGAYLYDAANIKGVLQGSGVVEIWVKGLFGINSTGLVRADSGIPSKLWVFGPSGAQFHVDASAYFYGVFYGPQATAVLNTGAAIWGVAVASTVSLNSGAVLNYDQSLATGCSKSLAMAEARQPSPNPKPPTPVSALLAAPNPAQGRVWARYDMPQPGTAQLLLYDLRGSLVRRWPLGALPAGPGLQRLELQGLAPGLYFLGLQQQYQDGQVRMNLFKLAIQP
jgi:hypothetical protein